MVVENEQTLSTTPSNPIVEVLKMTEPIVEKACIDCKEMKPLTEYYHSKQNKSGYHGQCKSCLEIKAKIYRASNPEKVRQWSRTTSLWAYYRLTLEEYDKLAAQQKGLCALCGNPPATEGRHTRLQVDHCHKTGRIRGLLCNSCNNALGRLGDSVEGLQRAVDYLIKADECLPLQNDLIDRRRRGEKHHWNTNPEVRMIGEKHGMTFFTEEQIKEFRRRYDAGEITSAGLAREQGVLKTTMQGITSRRNWKYVK